MHTCLKCGSSLEQLVFQGVEVERCLNCAGLWFDSLEADTLKQIKGSEALDLGDLETSSQLDDSKDEVECPKCKVKMIHMLDIDRYSIWYEKCPHCHGIWLDAGEFRKFKQNFKPRSFHHLASKVFRFRMK